MLEKNLNIIQTKLFKPNLPVGFIPRPQLIEVLENHHTVPLSLVSAPAGYGKSTTLSSWLDQCGHKAAWLSLDESDNDLRVFITYFLSSLQTKIPKIGLEILYLMDEVTLPKLTVLANLIINELFTIKENFIFVIDDFHIITNPDILNLMTSILKHPSKKLHIVLSVRHDPITLPLSRYRAKGIMNEIRIDDLKFTKEETSRFLSAAYQDDIDENIVKVIYDKTDGWPAVLRLTLLSLQQQTDIDLFIKKLESGNQYIMDYLLDEVVSTQTPEFREHLLVSSIFNRFNISLCGAICNDKTKSAGAAKFIKWLIENNLFIVQLDDEGIWFRYHHLFKEILFKQLIKHRTKDEINQLYIFAGDWFLENSTIEESINYYTKAEAWGDAVCALASIRYEIMGKLQWHRLKLLVNKFPTEIVSDYSELLLSQAWIYDKQNNLGKLFQTIDRIKNLIPPNKNDWYTKSLKNELELLMGLKSVLESQPEQGLKSLKDLLKELPSNFHFGRAYTIMLSSIAYQMMGNIKKARKIVYDAIGKEGKINIIKTHCLYSLCFFDWLTVDLQNLEQNASQLLMHAEKNHLFEIIHWGRFYLGALYYSLNDLVKAETYLSPNENQTVVSSAITYSSSIYILCLIKLSKGKSDEAEKLLNKLNKFALESDNDSLLIEAKAFRAELALRQNKIGSAIKWSKSYDHSKFGIVYTFYSPLITFIKVLIYEKSKESLGRVKSLLSDAINYYMKHHNTYVLIQLYSLQSLYYFAINKDDEALYALEKAITESESAGHYRIYLDLGSDMHELLIKYRRFKSESSYIEKLLQLFEDENDAELPSSFDEKSSNRLIKPLTTSLSNRELEILILISQRYQNKEIASKLSISLETVKRHASNIYEKLDVKNRRDAVDRALSMKIIPTV